MDENSESFDDELSSKKEENNNDKELKELLDLFKKEFEENSEDEEDDFDRFALKNIKESYTYQKKKDVLSVSLTTGNDLIVSDGEEQILIKNNMINHLLETIEHIRGQK